MEYVLVKMVLIRHIRIPIHSVVRFRNEASNILIQEHVTFIHDKPIVEVIKRPMSRTQWHMLTLLTQVPCQV